MGHDLHPDPRLGHARRLREEDTRPPTSSHLRPVRLTRPRMAPLTVLDSIVDFVTAPASQRAVLQTSSHRPWPLPASSWVMAQTWQQLLFAHWRLPASDVKAHVPAELPLDVFEGDAWIGLTPFRLTGLRARWTFPLPALSSFAERPSASVLASKPPTVVRG